MKAYFARLGDTLVIEQAGRASKQTTIFNQLMLTAYKEFQNINMELIVNLRKTIQLDVIQSMDLYSKKSIIRSLKNTSNFKSEELLYMCDIFYSFLYYQHGTRRNNRIGKNEFFDFIAQICDWGTDMIGGDDALPTATVEKTGLRFMDRLFVQHFDTNGDNQISFEDIVIGIGKIVKSSASTHFFFTLHDSDKDGFLSREDLIELSESLLFLFRKMQLKSDSPLGAVSTLLNRAFKLKQLQDEFRLDFETFQELVIADGFLVEYFATFPSTFNLTDTKSGVFVNTENAVQVQEIAETFFTGGLKWAAEKMKKTQPKPNQATNNGDRKEQLKSEERTESDEEFHSATEDLDDDDEESIDELKMALSAAGIQ